MIQFQSNRLYYRTLSDADITKTYVDWLNDPQINRYLEIRNNVHTLQSCRDFVTQMNESQDQHLLGIFIKSEEKHIGNIKLGFLNKYHSRAQLSLFIGEIKYWGKGFATEAIREVTRWGFTSLALAKIEAGCYQENFGSLRAFLKVGYQVEGFFRSHVIFEERRMGTFYLGILPNEVC
ncbi:MAG: GNAT family N-acetyltransferase [Oscillatoria sp. SIO1A7]|nr:GNAT family N-acetyltransferase [Oscillatoria sp. SIO1A7]